MMSGQQESKSEQSVKSGIQSQNQQPDRDPTQTQTQNQNLQSDQWDQQECQKLIERVASLEIQYNEMKEQVDGIEQKQWGMEEKFKEQLLYQMEDFYKQKLQSHIKPLITQLLSQMEKPILTKVSNQQCQVEQDDNLKSQSIDITQKQCNEKDDRYNSVLIQLEEQKSLIVNIQGEIQEKYRLQQQNLQSQQLQVDDQYNRIQQQLDNQQEGLKQIKEIQYQLQATLKHNDDKLNKVEELYGKFNTLNQEALSQGDKAVTKIELSNGLEKLKEHINQSHQEKYNQLLQEIVNLQDTTNKSIQAGSKRYQLAYNKLNQEILVIQDEMSKTITISEKKQNLHNEQIQQQIKNCRNSQQVQTEQLSEDNINKLQQQFSIQLTDQKQITDQMQQKIENNSIELQQITPQLQNVIKMQQTLVEELQAIMNNKEDKLTNIQNQVGELKSEFTTLKSGIQKQIEQNVKTNENTLLRVSKQIEEQAETVNKLETKVGNIRQEISQRVNNSQLNQKDHVEKICQQLRKEMVTSVERNIKDLELIISIQSGQMHVDLHQLKLQIQSLENYDKGVEEQVEEYKTQIEETLKNHENKLTDCQNVYSEFKKKFNKLEKDYQNSFDSKNTQVFEQRIIALEQKYIDFEQIQKSYKAELDKTAQQTQGELLKLQDQLDKMSKEVQISNETLSQVQLELKRKSDDVSVQLESCNNQLLKNKAQLSRQVVQLNEIVHQLEDIEKSFNIDKSARIIAGENSKINFITDNKSNLPNEPLNQQNTSNYGPPSFLLVDSNDQMIFQSMNLANVTEISQQILDSKEIDMHNKYLQLQAQKLKALKLIDQLYDLSCRKRVIPEEFKAFVGSKQDFQGLLKEYGATGQFQQLLAKTLLDGFRKVRTDGNSFYTSLIFQYLLLVLSKYDNQMFDNFMNNVKTMRFELIYGEGFRIQQDDEKKLKEEFLEQLQRLRYTDNKEMALEEAFDNQDIFCGLAIIYIRNLAYQLYQIEQKEQQFQFFNNKNSDTDIITWESSKRDQITVVISLLAQHLDLQIIVYYIDNCNCFKLSNGEEGKEKVFLIHRPEHYQIGIEYIHKNS